MASGLYTRWMRSCRNNSAGTYATTSYRRTPIYRSADCGLSGDYKDSEHSTLQCSHVRFYYLETAPTTESASHGLLHSRGYYYSNGLGEKANSNDSASATGAAGNESGFVGGTKARRMSRRDYYYYYYYSLYTTSTTPKEPSKSEKLLVLQSTI